MDIDKERNHNKVTGLNKETVFITGATGFIGSHIAKKIIIDRKEKIILLVRAEDDATAMIKLQKEWWDWKEVKNVMGDRVEVLAGDVCKHHFGVKPENYQKLISNVTHIIHAAAETRIDVPLKELTRVNVEGVKTIIRFAEELYKKGKLSRLSHLSTAYVCGRRTGRIQEGFLNDSDGFISDYELSKYRGELLIREVMDKLPVTVFRPSMVIGDSTTGEVKTFNTIYYPLRLYLNRMLRVFPVKNDTRLDFVPVDYVADSIVNLTFVEGAKNYTFHLTSPFKCQPTLKAISDYTAKWVKKNLMMSLPSPLFIPVYPSIVRLWYRLLGGFNPGSGNSRTIKNILSLIDYFYTGRQFDRKNTQQFIGDYEFQWNKCFNKILEFAVYNGFLHRSGRTVHEQILFRLGRGSRKINYYDVSGKNVDHRRPEDIKKEILLAANAMIEYGLKPGDRVVVVGYNSTRYLSIDTAIGLIGAINVPLYYTTPAERINEVLKECGARLIFIGRRSYIRELNIILQDLDNKKVSAVAFFKDENAGISVSTWEDFLMKSRSRTDFIKDFKKYTLPQDISTIRYSSGTTGKPRGVIFDHYNLRWMAESLNSLFPWKERNSKVTYLSFLPLNHVVEGILSNYSLYYTPAPADIYFLQDFNDLGNALPHIKPTAFFSVPRFYEKVYENFNYSGLGRFYNRTPALVKKLFRPMIKYIILKKAGLNRCVQPIVGSAPVSTELLLWFESLGIHIHNAYGLTEAPLVTLNRLGRNRVGTAGQLLPETKIKICNDMEIAVRGPQVTRGYYKESEPDQHFMLEEKSGDKYLLTGDIGELDEDGYLVIRDRKKDVIITSYGKNIQPFHIESKLKNIHSITEVMLVGDEKPYCAALIWLKEDSNHDFTCLDKKIVKINKGFSAPDKIKRWVFMKYNLNISEGLLTPNLKLRRRAIFEQNKDLIDIIYDVTDIGDFETLNDLLSEDEKIDMSDKRITKLFETAIKSYALHFGYLMMI